MNKSGLIKAAGLSCGPGCLCAELLASTLTDAQTEMIAHIAGKNALKTASAIRNAAGNGASDEFPFGGHDPSLSEDALMRGFADAAFKGDDPFAEHFGIGLLPHSGADVGSVKALLDGILGAMASKPSAPKRRATGTGKKRANAGAKKRASASAE